MRSKYLLPVYFTVLICGTIFSVGSAPASQTSTKDIAATSMGNKALASPISQVTTKKPKRSPKANTVRESEEGENEVEIVEADGGGEEETPSVLPKRPKDLPRFPSFNKPFDEFQADLEKIFDHINAGLEKVVEGFHELVHDPGVSHDKMFITAYDPNMFKDMIAKYDEQQAARRRSLEEQKTQAKAARIALRTTTAKSTLF